MLMRILVEPGSYGCHNLGDVAMMQVAVTRLNELWPGAEIDVLTFHPDLLARYCPSATPLETEGRKAWLSGRSLSRPLQHWLPPGISARWQRLEHMLWLRCPQLTDIGVHLKAAMAHRSFPSASGFRKHLTGASLLVVSGAGMLNDAFADHACPLLDELEFVLRAGVPVVAFGQGVGPITDPVLLAKARAVLPRLKLIGLREGQTGLPLLKSLGVPPERILVTGDDAIEPAFRLRPNSLGNRIGINLRLASYAGTGQDIVGKLREPLRAAAQGLNSSLVSVPISFHDEDSDARTNSRLLEDRNQESQPKIESPEDVIRLIGDCRVVVTGSYHGGVFALAQGIPVVGLVQSDYYEQKFAGLQQQFPGGCRAIDFRRPVASGEIQAAIHGAWQSAELVRDSLLRAASSQVELGRAAYRTAFDLLRQ